MHNEISGETVENCPLILSKIDNFNLKQNMKHKERIAGKLNRLVPRATMMHCFTALVM